MQEITDLQILCTGFSLAILIHVIESNDGKDDSFCSLLIHLLMTISKNRLAGIYKYAEKQAIIVIVNTKTE